MNYVSIFVRIYTKMRILYVLLWGRIVILLPHGLGRGHYTIHTPFGIKWYTFSVKILRIFTHKKVEKNMYF